MLQALLVTSILLVHKVDYFGSCWVQAISSCTHNIFPQVTTILSALFIFLVWRYFLIVREEYIYIYFFFLLSFSSENSILLLVLLYLPGNMDNLLIFFSEPLLSFIKIFLYLRNLLAGLCWHPSKWLTFSLFLPSVTEKTHQISCKKNFEISYVLFFQRWQTIAIQQNLRTNNYFQ